MSRVLHIAAVIMWLSLPAHLLAQEGDVSLGDLARTVRKSKAPQDQKVEELKVIDNDNFAVMMDKAESARLNGKPVFSIDPVAKTFTMTSPDGSCSLSFDAKASALVSTSYIASDLPQDELLKLEGPATILDDMLEVSVHNGTAWELKEIVVGITVLQQPGSAVVRSATLMPASDAAPAEKLPDLTVLYHLKGAAAPDSTTIFRGSLGGSFGEANSKPDSRPGPNSKDWHWAIVAARGIPPASPAVAPMQAATPAMPGINQPLAGAAQLPDRVTPVPTAAQH